MFSVEGFHMLTAQSFGNMYFFFFFFRDVVDMCSGLLPVLGIYMTLDYVNVRYLFNLKIPI